MDGFAGFPGTPGRRPHRPGCFRRPPLVPRTALATPARFSSSLGRSPYLDSAVFLLNPISAGRDGQIGAKVLLSSVNPFGLGKFDIRDFMVPFRETKHQQEAPWENLSLLGPRESLNDPFEVVLSGSGLGASLLDARLANWSDHRRAHEASYLTSWWESFPDGACFVQTRVSKSVRAEPSP